MTDTLSNNKRIAKNTLMLYIRQFFVLLLGLYSARVLLRVLGVSDYGTYNVVGGIVVLFSFINNAMISSTLRFLAFDIGLKDLSRVNKSFNSLQFIHIGIALLTFLIAESIGLWFLNKYLVIPLERVEAARWVFHFTILSTMVTIIQVPYIALIKAEEKMSFYASVSIIEVVLKFIVVFLIMVVPQTVDKMIAYSFLLFVVSILVAIIYRAYSRIQFSYIKFNFSKDWKYIHNLISFSIWNMIGSFSQVFQTQGISILINLFFGPSVNAAQAIATQASAALGSFQSNFQTASNPQIIKSYAESKTEDLINLITRTSKFSVFLVSYLIIPAYIEIDYLLAIWLTTPPNWASNFTLLILVTTLLTAISGSLVMAIQATGRIAKYQIITSIFFILTIPITFISYKLEAPPIAAYIVCIVISIITLIIKLLILREQLPSFQPIYFLKEAIAKPITIVSLTGFMTHLITTIMIPSITRVIIVTATSTIILSTLLLFFGLSVQEQGALRRSLLNLKTKYTS